MKRRMIPIIFFFLVFPGVLPIHADLYAQVKVLRDTFPGKQMGREKLSPDLRDYYLFHKDDFNGNNLDTNFWSYRREGATIDNSLYLRNNAKVKNGKLYLITDRYENKFSAISISTEKRPRNNFKYGYFEVKAKLPKGVGNVGAFWLQSPGMSATYPIANPSVFGAEIDIFEYSASNKDNLFHSLHWNGYDYPKGAQLSIFQDYLPGVSAGYHTFALEWTPTEYIVYVDNLERKRSNSIISHVPQFIILSCGTGGFGGANREGPWPDTLTIEYLKVYKRKPEVRLYELCDGYGKVSDALLPGNYTATQLAKKGLKNNAAGAIEVPQGWKVKIFSRDNFAGKSFDISNDTRCLDSLPIHKTIYSLIISRSS